MILGIGTDIVEIERIKAIIEKHGDTFLQRIFLESEREYGNQFAHPEAIFAGRFAAKEAVSKALGTGFSENLSMSDIEICNDLKGKPVVILSDKAKEHFNDPQLLISISHEKQYATATAIWQE